MKIENIKALTISQKKKLSLDEDDQYYLVLPDNPAGGMEVDIIRQSGQVIQRITLADAFKL